MFSILWIEIMREVPVKIPPSLLRLPDVRQTTDYSCGPSALQSVLMYYGEEHSEPDLMELCQADPQEGTPPERLAEAARSLGFQAEVRQHMTLEDLQTSVDQGIPVIIAAQAWREEHQLETPWNQIWDSGHWMVVAGLDEENVYFEDPSILGSLGSIPRQEFLERWHDVDDKPFLQGGVLISGKAPSPPPTVIRVD